MGDSVTMVWTLARVLLPDEHFHLRKAPLRPDGSFPLLTPEAYLATTFTETDTSAWIQFFDLRVADLCENESAREYPPGFDP